MVSPASAVSLRQQLTSAKGIATLVACEVVDEAAAYAVRDAIWPVVEALVEAAVSAARAETAEQIAKAIEATEYPHPFSTPRDELVYKLATQEAANRARSVPGTTEGQSDG